MAPQLIHNTLSVDIVSSWESDELAQQWLELEKDSETASFFLSWSWIANWLSSLASAAVISTSKITPELVRIYDGEKLVGLCFLVFSSSKSLNVIPFVSLYINQSGLPHLDQIWPEYNGLLVAKGYDAAAYRALVNRLNNRKDWDQCVSGVVTTSVHEWLSPLSDLAPSCRYQVPCYAVDLKPLRESGSAYIGSLSKNTRQQMRRCIKAYEGMGDISLSQASSLDEAFEYFEQLGALHKARWGRESGFYNAHFVQFHRDLIANSFTNGQVELCRLSINGEHIGFLYNLIFKNTLYFYMSGIDYARAELSDNRLKPGMLLHLLRIQRCLEQSDTIEKYDFMGGEARYKKSLSNLKQELVIYQYRKKRWFFLLELALRYGKGIIMKNIKREGA